MLNICGTPTNETLGKITSEEAILYIRSLPNTEKKDFSTVFPGANPLAIDLLERMLEVDADKERSPMSSSCLENTECTRWVSEQVYLYDWTW